MRPLEGIREDISSSIQPAAARELPVGVRLLVILGSAILGWAIPLGIVYLLW